MFEGTKFLVPPGAIEDVLEIVDTCHMGFPKAIGYAKARYYWPKMSQSVEAHCNNCLICIQHSEAKPAEDVLPPAKFNRPEAPFEVISCDEFSFRHKNYLMICDAYSNYSRAVHLPGKRTATVLINHILQWMLDFGFSRVLQSDGARVFTGQEFQEFLENNKIQHRLSAPMKSNSNGRAEERIKCYKNMLTKLYAEGRTTEADARSTWELLNQMPSKPGEFSPARLAFRRERRHPMIPALPDQGGEIEQGRKQQEEKEKEQVRRNSKRGKNVKKPPPFKVGQRVLTQKFTSGNAKRDRSFTVPAKVISIRPDTEERSAVLELANGTTTIRDRSHCVIDPTQPQPDTIDNILSSQGTYLKLITKPQGAKGDEQQALDVMIQKYKARGEEVEIKAIIGDAILLETTLQNQLNSCLKKSPSPERKRDKLRFNLSQECDDEQ